GHDASFLLTGARLAQFEEWTGITGLALTTEERDYLMASLAERAQQTAIEKARQKREAELERRARTFLRAMRVCLLLAALAAFGLTGVDINQSNIARQNEAEARSLALASRAQLALNEGNTDTAVRLAEQDLQIGDNSLAHRVQDQAAYAPGRGIFREN